MFNIYTDGACKGNGQIHSRGGWGYVILNTEDKNYFIENSGNEINTTNNRMEMIAVINALLNFSKKEEKINIYTDSAYIHNCIKQKWYYTWKNNGWINSKKEPVKNKDLWEQIIPYFDNDNITFIKVKGHNGDKWNEYVDKLAIVAAERLGE